MKPLIPRTTLTLKKPSAPTPPSNPEPFPKKTEKTSYGAAWAFAQELIKQGKKPTIDKEYRPEGLVWLVCHNG